MQEAILESAKQIHAEAGRPASTTSVLPKVVLGLKAFLKKELKYSARLFTGFSTYK